MKPKRKLLAWPFFALAILLILFLTVQNSGRSGELSNRFLECVYRFIKKTGLIDHPSALFYMIGYRGIRKLAHVAEYCLLGISSMIVFGRSVNAFLKAVGLCAFISVADQFIKIFVPGREFDWTDLPYDMAGYLIGTLIVLLIIKIRTRREKNEDRT